MSPPDRKPKSLSILFSCAFPVSTSHLKTLTEKKKVRKKKNSYWEGRQKGRSEKRKQEGRGKGNEGGKEGGHIGSVLGAVQPTSLNPCPGALHGDSTSTQRARIRGVGRADGSSTHCSQRRGGWVSVRAGRRSMHTVSTRRGIPKKRHSAP